MATVHFLCGKICSGKTTFARRMLEENRAFLLSCDELTDVIFHKDLGERHDIVLEDVKKYLHLKAHDALHAGLDVILDWGFWKSAERAALKKQYDLPGVVQVWHYMDVDDAQWQRNIEKRNADVLEGKSADYFVDEALKQKLLANFEAPSPDEIDIRHTING